MNGRPSYKDLIDDNGEPVRGSYAMGLHPNPRLYKFQWQIFHRGMPEGKAFFSTPALSTYYAVELSDKLRKSGQGYLIYNSSEPRADSKSPLDFSHECWKNSTPAPAFDDDVDPEWNGHK